MSERRVAITGIGIVSPFGRGAAAAIAGGRAGRSVISPITQFDASSFLCRIAGNVPPGALGSEYPDYDRFARFALIAADEAAAEAKLDDPSIDRRRIGTLVATGLGGCETLDAGFERLYLKGSPRIPPVSIPRSMYNAAASAVAARHRAFGPSFAISSACASGTHGLAQAALWIRSGIADVVLAGGADAPITPGIVRAWEGLRVLANDNDAPAEACRPFSADRKGLVLAEGSAIFVLEEMDHATRRGAALLGEICGAGMTSDGGHVTDPSIDGTNEAIAIALRDAGWPPGSVAYINAHGTGTRANDPLETAAIKRVFGDDTRVAVSSTKSMHGHAMGASGAIEAALSLLCLNQGFIPPTANLTAPDPACDLDYVAEGARDGRVERFLSNSFGFGGMNGVVAIATRSAVR
ncbi:MAG: beta-ketoacyl-[acyl-carrier-protein] synthase family protein [Thermoanaerobaculia bacterium]